eukprot:15444155-Alexandrium_andersonii.AAC.1
MNEKFTRKVEGRLGGDARGLQEVKLLNSIIRWAPNVTPYEADPRHAEQLLRTYWSPCLRAFAGS